MHNDTQAASCILSPPEPADFPAHPFPPALQRIGRVLMALGAAGGCMALACRLVRPETGSIPSVVFAAGVVSGWLLLLGSVLTMASGVKGRVRALARLVLAATGTYFVGRLIRG
ncbi:hypothetical protein KTD31_00670 [Burkholderia multivorans]|uniref:hypothetical protein n=1 Tax=Burkholderia multivorans TaxID=87883 RepID=UPI001C245791|nr:hypothetical protein [Burkholderia multivorans]MBU9199913.1 hypothetical protein [Burkholderia multivorans]MDN8078968.1 hypothetical protein [Burkholderia multivorans]